MSISEETITVKFQTAEEECHCCGTFFEKLEYGEIREFDITLKALFEYAGWEKALDNFYPEESEQVVDEYLCETIRFYAARHTERVRLCEGELSRVNQLVLDEIKKWGE